MPKVLLVTNDFPPRKGGIQSFVEALAMRLPPEQVVVCAPAWQEAGSFDRGLPFPVVRYPHSLMLPSPKMSRHAAAILRQYGCDKVLFGAAAPLGLLAPALRRAGARQIVALTHGHEAWWAALPVTRHLLRRIGNSVDVITYLGPYFRARLARALSPAAMSRAVQLLPGVDTTIFRPGVGGAAIRQKLGLADRPIILCVSRLVPRKGQDTLISALPDVLAANAAAPVLLLVGDGPYARTLRRKAHKLGVSANVVFAGEVASDDLPAFYDSADIFAMPCRTRRCGFDVEGLGIVFLEAAAAALPVIGGDSGGAPDAVLDGETGFVVPGGDAPAVAERLNRLLADPAMARVMGQKGRDWMEGSWRWDGVGERLRGLLEL